MPDFSGGNSNTNLLTKPPPLSEFTSVGGGEFTTYAEIKERIGNEKLPVSSTNENGELVIIENGKSEDDVPYYQLITIQNNDWCRINNYYADGMTTETFER